MSRRAAVLSFLAASVLGCASSRPAPPDLVPGGAPPAASSKVVEAVRISGEKTIVPDEEDKVALGVFGWSKVETTYKICLDAAGVPSSVATLQPSGLPGYDAKIRAAILTWRYRPSMVDGVAQPSCTSITFVYEQNTAPADGGAAAAGALLPSRHAVLFRGRELLGPGAVRVPLERPVPAAVFVLTQGGREPREGERLLLDLAPAGSPYEIALWASPEEIATVVRVPVLLAREPRVAGTGAGVASAEVSSTVPGFRLRRGTPVELLARIPQQVKVRFQEGALATAGWVPATALGTSFLPEETASFAPVELVELSTGTSLLDRPGGAALEGNLSAEMPGTRIRATVLQRREAHALVRIGRSTWWALGWVPEAALRPRDDAQGAPLVRPVPVESGAPSGGASLQLARGTPLLHQPRGTSLGRALAPHEVRALEVKDGHSRIAIRTAPGVIHVWVPVTP